MTKTVPMHFVKVLFRYKMLQADVKTNFPFTKCSGRVLKLGSSYGDRETPNFVPKFFRRFTKHRIFLGSNWRMYQKIIVASTRQKSTFRLFNFGDTSQDCFFSIDFFCFPLERYSRPNFGYVWRKIWIFHHFSYKKIVTLTNHKSFYSNILKQAHTFTVSSYIQINRRLLMRFAVKSVKITIGGVTREPDDNWMELNAFKKEARMRKPIRNKQRNNCLLKTLVQILLSSCVRPCRTNRNTL